MSHPLLELEHRYGKNYHILNDPFLSTLLALLCSRETRQPLLTDLIKRLYQSLLLYVIGREFPCKNNRVKTRMFRMHKEAVLREKMTDFGIKVVTVDLARAGIVPSQLCYDFLNHFFKPQRVRQDHAYIQRMVNHMGQVTGSHIGGYKIGGPVHDAIVLLPDPMGATGASICETVALYKNKILGKPLKFIALHLIITPEYLKKVKKEHSDLIVYALRLDRGLSSKKILRSAPGTYWHQEKGLNQNHYIVPGAGGLGELLNNSFV